MLDTTAWPGTVDDYVDALVWLVGELLADPKHFFRSFTVKELGRLMVARPSEPVVRAHEMGIYKRYFDLIVTGRKTVEIRVNDSRRKKIRKGSLIRFRCQGDSVLTRVTHVARYTTFDEMFDHESAISVNPLATREEQLANIRQIYPPNARSSVSLRSASNSPSCSGERDGLAVLDLRRCTPRALVGETLPQNVTVPGALQISSSASIASASMMR